MSLTITVKSEIEVKCSMCGETLDCRTYRSGNIEVKRCKLCLRKHWDEAYEAGLAAGRRLT